MEEKEQTIDLRVLLKVLKDHLLPIAAAAVLAAVVGLILSAVIIPKKYTSEAMMYVENSADKETSSSININDINAAQKIVSTCQILFTSNYVLGELKESFDSYSVTQLKDMITIESVNSTQILKFSVTTLDPQTSADMAARLVELSTAEFKRVIGNGSIETVSAPTLPKNHTFPSVPQFTLIGLLIGLVVSYAIFLIIELVDVKVKPTDDLMQMYNIPVFAEIMDFENTDKGGYKYHYYSSSNPETSAKSKNDSKTKSIAPLKKDEASAPDSSAVDNNGDIRKENA